ncbi:hypothetical protein EV368DRAFT_77332 [Lentinula lateritia]|nr:hypothetical protein EV368DRAFT_77332 [Lentinula lateritia]
MQSSSSTDAPTGTPPSTTPSSLYPPLKDPWATVPLPPAKNKPGKSNLATHHNAKTAVAPPRSSHLPKSSSPFGYSYRLREQPPYGQGIPSSSPPSPSLRPASYLAKRYQRPQKNESRCLQYVLPGLYIAFESDRISFGPPTSSLRIPPEEELRTTDGERFTHIIKLNALKDQSQSPVIQHYVASYETQVLNLGVSSNSPNCFGLRMRKLTSRVDGVPFEAAHRLYTDHRDFNHEHYGVIPSLTHKQLLASREFMCGTGHDLHRHQGARILITAPRDHCTDMISVLTCYLAYASGNTAAMVIHEIDKHEGFLGIWKNTVSQYAVSIIQEVVDMRLC